MRLSVALSFGLALAACGDEKDEGIDASTPRDTGTSQDASPPDALPEDTGVLPDAGTATLTWTSCYQTLECTTIAAPVDYADPNGETIELAVARQPAKKPAQRIGSLFFNPGGPGASGILVLPFFAADLQNTAPVLADRFDLVAVDWRGVGLSRPEIACFTPEEFQRIAMLADPWRTPEERASLITFAEGLVAACGDRNDPTFALRTDSENAARDMDLVREALGEDKLTYYGASYGTVLGAKYAALFPDRVGAVVLDSPITFTSDPLDVELKNAVAYSEVLDRFLLWVSKNGRAPGALMGTTSSLSAGMDQLIVDANENPTDAQGFALPGGAISGITRGALGAMDWDRLAIALDPALTGSRQLLASLGGSLAPPPVPGLFNDSANFVVLALDRTPFPAGTTYEDIDVYFRDTIEPSAPHAFHQTRYLYPYSFLAWDFGRAEPAQPPNAETAPPLLVVSSELDVITPYPHAQVLQTALGNGSYLLTSQGGGHGVFRYNPCVRRVVESFLVDPSTPPATLVCPAERFVVDDTVIATATAEFPRDADDQRVAESALGNLIADAMRAKYGTQLAIMNGGGIRRPLPTTYLPDDLDLRRPAAGYQPGPPYDLVAGDVYEIMPFGNTVVTRSITGEQLWAELENAVGRWPAPNGFWYQISGFRFSFSGSAPEGARLLGVELDDGTPIARDQTAYTLATVDFVRNSRFPEAEFMAHDNLADVVLEQIRLQGTVTPTITDRVTISP